MYFYKVIGEDEKHYGMQYHTGLNVDVLPFNPTGDGDTGGIYFAREDILSFLYYGSWVRKVTLPEGEPVYENPGYPKKWKAHRVILGERELVDTYVVQRLLSEGADAHVENDWPLIGACSSGDISMVELFVSTVTYSTVSLTKALNTAVDFGYYNIVEFLLNNGADIHTKEYPLLMLAYDRLHFDVAKLLIRRGAVTDENDNWVLQAACYDKNFEIIELLIGKDWDRALYWACGIGSRAVIVALMEVHKYPYNTVQEIMSIFTWHKDVQQLREFYS